MTPVMYISQDRIRPSAYNMMTSVMYISQDRIRPSAYNMLTSSNVYKSGPY